MPSPSVEARLPFAPVVFLKPVGADLLRVAERQSLRPVVDALALGPSGRAQTALQIVELLVGRSYPKGFDVGAHI